MASRKSTEVGSLRLRDDWDPNQSAFQEDDNKYDGKPASMDEIDFDPAAARKEQKLQALGREIVSTLYMLIRNTKIHAPDNAIFLKPIDTLREAMNRVVASERMVNLQAADTNVYLNNTRLKFDFGALDSVNFLTQEFERRDIGGFSTNRPVTSQEIRDFLYVFTTEFGAVNEDGVEGRQLPSMKLARYAQVKELLDKLQAEPDLNQQVDRKKYMMTVYARAIVFMEKYIEKSRKGACSIPFAKAGRLIQELVDLCHDQKNHFLGVTTCRSDTDYMPYHSVNTALLSVVFGAELGLDKRQLHDLGMAALFSQIGLTQVSEQILARSSRLSAAERKEIDLSPLRSAKQILYARGLDKTTMMRIVAAFESKVDYAVPRKTKDGDVQLVMPKMGLGVYGKIIAICECYDALTSKRPFREAYGPEIALALMSSQIKFKFDPVLLRVFMKVMAIQPVKILESGQRDIRIG